MIETAVNDAEEAELRRRIQAALVANGLVPEPQPEPQPDLGFQPLQGVSAAALRDMVFPPPAWILDEVIPGGLTLLAGKPKLGKSYLMLDLGVAVARGGFVLDRKCVQGDVAYMALEDGLARLQRRLNQIVTGDWPERLMLYTEMSPLSENGLKQLRAWAEAAAEPRLIIIDVFTKVRRIAPKHEGAYQGDYNAAGPLKELADDTGVAIIVVHHLRKQTSEDDPLDMVSGSTGLTGAADTIVVLDRKAAGVTLYARGRDIEEVEWAVEFDKRTGRWSNKGEAKEARMDEQKRKVIRTLREEGEPLSPKQLAERSDLSLPNAKKTMARMADKGEITRLKRGQYALNGWDPVPTVSTVPDALSTEGK